jgi:response regulator RpfG family c-di-GMP phosphodiesterase
MDDAQMAERKERILIVDDQVTNLQLLAQILEMAGYEVQTATTGARALQAAQVSPPDIILLDVMMPGLSGFEVGERLQEMPETGDVPIIFLSALSSVEDKVKGFNAGGVDYITKPFRGQEVVLRVATHLTLRRLQKELQAVNHQLEQRNAELEHRNMELQEALNTIKTLSGLIPICAWCGRKIENEDGEWVALERYIEAHSEASFTHGMCPDCLKQAKQESRQSLWKRRYGPTGD